MRRILRASMKLTSVVIVVLLMIAMTVTSFAADTVTVDVTGTYGQTEARSMLNMVNDFRTGRITDGGQSTVWAYNDKNQIDTASYANLGKLQYDYELEKVAKERAMELVLQFDHSRPNGEYCNDLFPDGYSAKGENIATGYGGNNETAEEAFESWCEAKYSYSGQGHRRNMLGRGYNRIGIAHVVVDYSGDLTEGDRNYHYTTQIHYWVQEFGYRNDSYGLTATAADDNEATLPIDVLSSNIEHVGIETDADSYEMTYGDTLSFNGAKSVIRLAETWPEKFELTWNDGYVSKGTYYVTVGEGYSLSSANSNIATVSGKTITARKVGNTSLTVTSDLDNSVSKSVPLTVKPASIDDATATVSGSFVYDGTAHKPAVTVKKNGKTLTADTDYTVVYEKNTNAGTATARVTGKGNYTGSCTTTFEIKPLQLSATMFNVDDSQLEYNGTIQKPEVSGRNGDTDMVQGTDYTVAYDEAVNAGTYNLSITGKGNYTGTVPLTFKIQKADYPPTMPENTYTVPYLTKKLDNKILENAEGWEFDTDDIGTDLIIGENEFVAKYTGKGAGNYIHETKNVIVAREKCGHAWSKWETTTEPTCLSEGEETRTCSDCNETETRSVDKLSHNLTIVNAVEPGCETEGNIEYWTCSMCKGYFDSHENPISKDSVIIPAKNHHEWGEWTTTTEPTCLSEGEETRTCSECSKAETRSVDKVPHNLTIVNAVEPGCETEGNIEYWTCSMCKEYFDKDKKPIEKDKVVITATGHTWGGWTTTTEPTCTKKGEETRTCSKCSKAETRSVDKLPHKLTIVNAVEPGCETEGNIEYYICDSCKRFFDNETDQKELTEEDVTVPATGHKWGAWETTREPSEAEAGEKVRKCSACEAVQTEAIPYKAPATDPIIKVDDLIPAGGQVAPGAKAAAVQKYLTTRKSDADPAGSEFGKLKLRIKKNKKTSQTLKWSKVPKAVRYDVYANKCGKANSLKKVASVKGTTYKAKKLKKGTYYKYVVIAVGSNGKVVSSSKVVHMATSGGKVGNDKAVKTRAKKNKVTIKKGKTFKLKGKAVRASKKLKVKKHVGIRYESSNPKVATVSKTGVIKGLMKGKTCYVYVYAQDGVYKRIKVKVS